MGSTKQKTALVLANEIPLVWQLAAAGLAEGKGPPTRNNFLGALAEFATVKAALDAPVLEGDALEIPRHRVVQISKGGAGWEVTVEEIEPIPYGAFDGAY